jgi:DNA-binding MarR family transcriptional regulator
MKLTPLVDEQTGELYYSAREVEERLNAAKRQRAAYKEKLEREQAKENTKAADNRGFIKVMNAGIDGLNEELKLIDAGLLFRLSVNMRMESGSMLVGKRDAYGKPQPLKQSDLQKVLGKSKAGIKPAINRLVSLGLLRKEKQGRSVVFFINESVVSIGKSVAGAQPFTKVYKKHAKDMLAKLTDSEAGLILKMTAYVNYHYLFLTHNPTEADAEQAKPLRLHEIAEKVAVEEKYFTVLVSNLKRKGAIATLDTGTKGKALLIHPSLCDRGNDLEQIANYVTSFFKIAQN